jgi:hypothetical protein
MIARLIALLFAVALSLEAAAAHSNLPMFRDTGARETAPPEPRSGFRLCGAADFLFDLIDGGGGRAGRPRR